MKNSCDGLDWAQKIEGGDLEAIGALLASTHRMVVNVFLRLVGDETEARALTESLYRRIAPAIARKPHDVPLPSWILEAIRDVAFESLGSEAWKRTIFVRARELLSEPSGLTALPADLIDEGSTGLGLLDDSFKSRLSAEHRLVLELLFVERIPAEDVAEVLDVSVTLLKSFVLAVFEDLAGLSHLEHVAECPPDVTLALDALSRMDRPDELGRLETGVHGCASCVQVVRRTRRVMDLFTIDSRPARRPAPELAGSLVRAADQRKEAARRKRERPTPQPVPRRSLATPIAPPPSSPLIGALRWLIPGVLFAGLGNATMHMFGPPPAVPTVAARTPALSPQIATLGVYANPMRDGIPLYAGQTLQSARNHQTMVDLTSGAQVMIEASGSALFDTEGTSLIEGRFGIAAPPPGNWKFTTGAVTAVGEAVRGLIDRRPGNRTEYWVTEGKLTLDLAGQVMIVDSRRSALYDEKTARIVVRDLEEPELAQVQWARPASSAPGSLAASGRNGEPRSTLPPFSMKDRARAPGPAITAPMGAGNLQQF